MSCVSVWECGERRLTDLCPSVQGYSPDKAQHKHFQIHAMSHREPNWENTNPLHEFRKFLFLSFQFKFQFKILRHVANSNYIAAYDLMIWFRDKFLILNFAQPCQMHTNKSQTGTFPSLYTLTHVLDSNVSTSSWVINHTESNSVNWSQICYFTIKAVIMCLRLNYGLRSWHSTWISSHKHDSKPDVGL